MKLVLVESPSKCKKLEGFLGRGYKCRASIGHICEIKGGLQGINTTTLEPSYAVVKGKRKTVTSLKELCRGAEAVFLATDPDREGEAIAYHLCLMLSLPVKTTPRIRFHEVTRDAVQRAFASPGTVQMNLVRAQQARQVLDLYVGYRVSPFLWKAVGPRLSAGRCQSPALRMLHEREQRVIVSQDQEAKTSFVMTANLGELTGCLYRGPLSSVDDALLLLGRLKATDHYVVFHKEETPRSQNPSAPFITSTVQQECAASMGIAPTRCMQLLQSLYEKGTITYIRTDSPSLSEEALEECRVVVSETYGTDKHERRQYASRSSTSQEAHEAIRPTKMALRELPPDFTEQERAVYRRLWRRTLASQMTAYRFTEQVLSIRCGTDELEHRARRTTEMGWKAVYEASPETCPVVEEIPIVVPWRGGVVVQELEKGVGRHSESSLLRELEKHGIGRPSTYASLGAKLLERGYARVGNTKGVAVQRLRLEVAVDYRIRKKKESVRVGDDKNKYMVTETGKKVVEFLASRFGPILEYGLTETMERGLETIVEDAARYKPVLSSYMTMVDECIHQA
jgi:DNA topoisomerase-1